MRKLEGHLECDVFLRGNVITLDGDADAVGRAGTVVRELAELIDGGHDIGPGTIDAVTSALDRSEEHTSELQSLMRTSYAVFCLNKQKPLNITQNHISVTSYTTEYRYHTQSIITHI